MTLNRFSFKDIDHLVIAAKDLSRSHPDICVIPNYDKLELIVESINSNIFDTRMISLIKVAGGKDLITIKSFFS